MKTFDNLKFKSNLDNGGIYARIYFNNGYGASVIQNIYSYGADKGLYELAVLDNEGHLTYDTPVTEDVEGNLTPENVTELLYKIQKLKPIKTN